MAARQGELKRIREAAARHLFVPAWSYPLLSALLLLALAIEGAPLRPSRAAQAPARVAGPQALYLPLVNRGQASEPLAADELTGTIAYNARVSRSALRLPFVAFVPVAAPGAAQPAPTFLTGQVPLAPALAAAPSAAPTAAPSAGTAPAPAPLDEASCKVYSNVRITWYELGSCCGKGPGHPQYGVTRSGMQASWGMAAVQARWPLAPLGARIIVKDLGLDYRFVVADTGSETAFGSSWVDIYAPTIPVGHWVERQVGRDGRSDVLVCP